MTIADVADVSADLKVYARKRWPLTNDKVRKSLLKAALGFTARRIKSLWEGEKTAVLRQREIVVIEKVIGKKVGAAAELEEARHEYRDLAQLAASLQALFYGPNADFYRPQVDAIREAILSQSTGPQGSGGDDGAGDHERSARPG